MKKWILLMAIVIASGVAQAGVIDFDSLDTGDNQYYSPTTDGSHDWSDGGASFNMNYSTNSWGDSWNGFVYSEVNDPTTGGYANQYAVYGDGLDYSDSGVYTVGYVDSYNAVNPTVSFDSAMTVNSLQVNNTAYTALDMISGSSFSSAFTTNDWLKLSIEGKDASGDSLGIVDVLLADFSGYTEGDDKDNYIVNDWEKVDLTSLGDEVLSVEFSLSSSDNSWGYMNTPAYFAVDNIDAIPEPNSVVLMVFGFGGILWLRRHTYFFRG